MQTLAALTLLCFGLGRLMPACGGVVWQFPPGDDLCHQFYRNNYRPSLLLHTLDKAYPGVPVLIESRDVWAMFFAQRNFDKQRVLLIDTAGWRSSLSSRSPQLVVSSNPIAARAASVGMATLTTVASTRSMNSPITKTVATSHL